MARSGVAGGGSWKRGRPVLASMVLVLAACTGSSDVSRDPSLTAAPTRESSPASPIELTSRHGDHPFGFNNVKKFEVPAEDMPYPYTTPVPPAEKTPIDGTYMRILTLDDVGGLLPFRCLRCPPYFPNAGVSTLAMSKGNYWLNHQLSGFRALGMYTVEGNRVTFFNDPWCPQDHGTYRWAIKHEELLFEAISGTCDYEKARADDLTTGHWIHIRPCIYRIDLLWPGPVAC